MVLGDNEHYFQNMGNSLTINMADRTYSTIGLSPQMRTPCMFFFLFSPLHMSCFNMHQDNRTTNPLKQVLLGFLWWWGFCAWKDSWLCCPILGFQFSLVQFSCSVVSDFLWPHESQTPGLPVHHQLPEFTQTHVHRVGDAIQQSHPLSSPSPPALNPSQHQSLFQWVNSLHEVAKVLAFQL